VCFLIKENIAFFGVKDLVLGFSSFSGMALKLIIAYDFKIKMLNTTFFIVEFWI
jgi:hypothetical protein